MSFTPPDYPLDDERCPFEAGDSVTVHARGPGWTWQPRWLRKVASVGEWPESILFDDGRTLKKWEVHIFVRKTQTGDAEAIERYRISAALPALRGDEWEKLSHDELKVIASRLKAAGVVLLP